MSPLASFGLAAVAILLVAYLTLVRSRDDLRREIVLLLNDGVERTGLQIYQTLIDAGRVSPWLSLGRLYATLYALEENCLLCSRWQPGEVPAVREGYRARLYSISTLGIRRAREMAALAAGQQFR